MLNRHSKHIDQIKIEFDKKFINSLSLLTRRKIEPIIINKDTEASKDAEDIIIGIKCPVIMNEETFDDDKKIVESDILKAFADILNSEICNRTAKAVNRTAKAVNRTAKAVNRTAKAVNRTAKAVNRTAKAVNREKIDTIYDRTRKKRKLKYKPIPCPVCESADTVRHGRRMTNIGFKSTHFCKQCDKYYTNQENAIWKMKNSRQVIEEAIELSKQFSLREAARQIREKYDIKISHSAILIWRRNKSKLLKNLDRQTKK